MTAPVFTKATKKRAFLRLALMGPSGSGKTLTALLVAQRLGQRIAVIDTERGSSTLYADRFDFSTVELTNFAPSEYRRMISACAAERFDVLIIDSLSHAWMGEGGILDQADKKGSRFDAWKTLTPQHNALVNAMLDFPGHLIATMRSKTDYLVDKDEKGRQTVNKVGLAPVQRDGMEYEFDVVGMLDHEHVLHVSKSRCPALAADIREPGAQLGDTLRRWLAAPPPPPSAPAPPDSAEGLPPMEAELIRQLFEAAEPGSQEWAAAKDRRAQAAKARTITQREHAELGDLARRLAEEHAAKFTPPAAPETPPEPERDDSGETFRAIVTAYRTATTRAQLAEVDNLCTNALTDGRLTRTQGKALVAVRKVAADRIAKTEASSREPGEEG